jgi:hypothetical protein
VLDLIGGHEFGIGQALDFLIGHAIGATEVAAIGQRYPEVIVDPVMLVNQHFQKRSLFSVRFKFAKI